MGGCKSKDITETIDTVKEILSLLNEFNNNDDLEAKLNREHKINLLLLNKKNLSGIEKDALYYVIEKNNIKDNKESL